MLDKILDIYLSTCDVIMKENIISAVENIFDEYSNFNGGKKLLDYLLTEKTELFFNKLFEEV